MCIRDRDKKGNYSKDNRNFGKDKKEGFNKDKKQNFNKDNKPFNKDKKEGFNKDNRNFGKDKKDFGRKFDDRKREFLDDVVAVSYTHLSGR